MSDRIRQVTGLPRVFKPVVECPAGVPIAETARGSGVECRLTDSPVLAQDEPRTLLAYCCSSGYRGCVVWLAEKERVEARRRESLLEA